MYLHFHLAEKGRETKFGPHWSYIVTLVVDSVTLVYMQEPKSGFIVFDSEEAVEKVLAEKNIMLYEYR